MVIEYQNERLAPSYWNRSALWEIQCAHKSANLDYVITFYLREDDPEYEDEDDNILMEFQSSHFVHDERDCDWGLGANGTRRQAKMYPL